MEHVDEQHAPNWVLEPLGLELDAAGAELGNNRLDATLVDDPQTVVAQPQANKSFLTPEPEPLGLQVWQRPLFGADVRVGDVHARLWAFSCNLANFRHNASASVKAEPAPISRKSQGFMGLDPVLAWHRPRTNL